MKHLLGVLAILCALYGSVPGNVVLAGQPYAGRQFVCAQPRGRTLMAARCITLYTGSYPYYLHQAVTLHYDGTVFIGITYR